MNRYRAVSLVVHLLVLATLAVAAGPPPDAPPVAVYSVQLVGAAAAAPPRKSAPPAPPPRARSGVKTQAPPSVDKKAPKGAKKPTQSVTATTPKAGTGAPGLRLEGEPFPFPEYLQDLLARVQEHWERPLLPAGSAFKATVFFSVQRDGSVTGCRVESGSGQLAFDRAAQSAVLAAAPLPRLPDGFRGTQLGVHLDFSE